MTTEQQSTDTLPPPPAWLNSVMAGMLRSPLHGVVSKGIMLITVTGRKSGKMYTLPVSYAPTEEGVICSTDRVGRSWWKNLRGGGDVTLRLRGKEVAGHATVIEDDLEAIADGIRLMLKYVPRDAKYYHVRLDGDKRPFAKDITASAQYRVIIEIKLTVVN